MLVGRSGLFEVVEHRHLAIGQLLTNDELILRVVVRQI